MIQIHLEIVNISQQETQKNLRLTKALMNDSWWIKKQINVGCSVLAGKYNNDCGMRKFSVRIVEEYKF